MSAVFRFDDWELWPVQRQLLRQGRPVTLGGRAFDLLQVLLEAGDRLVPTDELLERVWPGLAVEPNNLQVQVWALRRLLGPGAIANVARRGYRFTRQVRPCPLADAAALPGAAPPLAGVPSADGGPAAVAAAGLQAWLTWAGPLRTPALVTVTGAPPPVLRQAAEALAAHRRASRAAALWRIELPPGGALRTPWPDPDSRLWQRLAGAPGQLLLLDCHHAPQTARDIVRAARAAAPLLQLLATAPAPLGLAGERVADLADAPPPVQPAAGHDGPVPAPVPAPGPRWRARGGPGGR